MRAFAAIISNSFREAVDNKIFIVLASLSILMSLLILLVGFKDIPMEEAVSDIFKQIESQFRTQAPSGFETKVETAGHPPKLDRITRFERDGKTWYRAEFTVKEVERFRVKVPPMPGMPEFAANYEGETGMMSFIHFQTSMAGFSAPRIEKTGEGEYTLEARPGVSFRTAGAQKLTFLFGAMEIPLKGVTGRQLVFILESLLAKYVGGWVGVLVAIVVTAWFFPEMMSKGTVDLLLSKPVSRLSILLSKFLGGLLFVFINATILIGGSWFAFALKSGFWHPGYLGSILTMTFMFAMLYSVSVLAAVLWRNLILSIAAATAVWILCFLVNTANSIVNRMSFGLLGDVPEWIRTSIKVAYTILPSTSDMDDLSTYFMVLGEPIQGMGSEATLKAFEKIDFGTSIATSLAFIAVILALSYLSFRKKDF